MALMPELGKLVNRTSEVLFVKFDGEDYRLEPGENTVPKVIIPYAKNQLVVMGSEDEIDPSAFESLVGVPGKDDCSPIAQNPEELTRVQLQKVVGDGVKIVTRGKKKPSAFTAAMRPPEGGSVFNGEN